MADTPQDIVSIGNRIVESSPLVVLILLLGYFVAYRLISGLLSRLDNKDEMIHDMNTEMIKAISSVREAVEKLTEALNRGDKRN
jgi:hypothetical protein